MFGKKKQEDPEFMSPTYWKEMMGGFVAGFMKSMTGNLVDKARLEARRIMHNVQKSAVGIFIMLAGMIFVLIGLAIFINDIVGISHGIGYAAVGLVALLIGMLTVKN